MVEQLRNALAATLLMLSFACAERAPHEDVAEAISAAVARYVDAVNAGDPAGVAGLYLEGPEVSSIGEGQIYRGRETIDSLLAGIFGSVETVHLTAQHISVERLGPDAAVATFRYQLRVGGATTRLGAMTIVFRHERGDWWIVHEHSSALAAGTPRTVPSSAIAAEGPDAPAAETQTCAIAAIIDGDTVECRGIGRIRLIGMDTPEADQEPYGPVATRALTSLLPPGSEVEVELDVEPRDMYGRTLAYVWINDMMVNWVLVRLGYAVVLTYPPNVRYEEWFTAAQTRARSERAGLWAAGGFECLPRDRRRGTC